MRLAAALLPCLAQASGGLVDNPIVADEVSYLTAGWTASTPGGPTIPAAVPGDIITDLEAAGLVGDPLAELNFLNESAAWTNGTWTYRTTFTTTTTGAAAAAGDAYMLVFDGVKMGATVNVNGVPVGTATDQFLRYSFALTPGVLGRGTTRAGPHTLELVFDPAISCGGRWMYGNFDIIFGPPLSDIYAIRAAWCALPT